MPLVRAFRGLGYSLDRYGVTRIPERVRMADEPDGHPGRIADLTDLACPPYDVISDEQREELLARDPHNAVRLELSAERDPHVSAAGTLAEWRRDGTLERRADASVYYYNHATTADPDEPSVQGVLARVLLEPWGRGMRPHEHTLPAPKQDRLALLRATETQLSPILVVYFDRSERYRHVMSRAWTDEWRARDADGLLHQVAAVEADQRLLTYLSRQTLFVADGHHRYETALAYQAEVRSRPEHAAAEPGSLAADWIMCVLINAELEELQVFGTHRLLHNVGRDALNALAQDPGPLFGATPMPPDALPGALEAAAHQDAPVFGLVMDGAGYLLTGEREPIGERMRRERLSTAVQRLDLAVLHAAILEDRLGIDADAVGRGDSLTYTRSSAAAIEAVARGAADAAILVRPTPIDQMAAVANAGDVMPQKSTYFYPKLLTGMVFNPLSEAED
jgi:uncharacterized protein (DUF1015 family)